MLEKIRAACFKKALRAVLATQKRGRQAHTLESARTIGILFDATLEATRHEVLDYTRILRDKGKKVRLLGFFKTKQQPEHHPFDFFTLKDKTWIGKPQSEKVTAFSKDKLDLLLSMNPDEEPPLEWVAAVSQASMKIGFATQRPNDLDLQLETPERKGIRYFTEHVGPYLDKIVPTKYESARTT